MSKEEILRKIGMKRYFESDRQLRFLGYTMRKEGLERLIFTHVEGQMNSGK